MIAFEDDGRSPPRPDTRSSSYSKSSRDRFGKSQSRSSDYGSQEDIPIHQNSQLQRSNGFGDIVNQVRPVAPRLRSGTPTFEYDAHLSQMDLTNSERHSRSQTFPAAGSGVLKMNAPANANFGGKPVFAHLAGNVMKMSYATKLFQYQSTMKKIFENEAEIRKSEQETRNRVTHRPPRSPTAPKRQGQISCSNILIKTTFLCMAYFTYNLLFYLFIQSLSFKFSRPINPFAAGG